jgi:hypothetical protein
MSPYNSPQIKEGRKKGEEGRKERRNTETELPMVQLFHFMTGHNLKASI